MAYSLFSNRKIYYTNLVYNIQSQLNNIMQQKISLTNFSANISDGVVTIDEIASDASNLQNYKEYLEGADAYINTPDDEGGSGTSVSDVGALAAEQNDSEEYLASIAEMLNTSVNEAYATQATKKLEALENQLDLKQKQLETKLTAAQSQLETIEQAEAQAIQKATPKYAGLG